MNIKKKLISRTVAGETVLVPIGAAFENKSGLFVLTESGAFIWSVLPDCETEEEIVLKLLDEYEVEEELAKTDVKNFLDNLRKYNIID